MTIRDLFDKIRGPFLLRNGSAFLRDERGATVIEYGLIVGILSLVILVSMLGVGSTIRDDVFNTIAEVLQGASTEED